jgi:hypothetical protein
MKYAPQAYCFSWYFKGYKVDHLVCLELSETLKEDPPYWYEVDNDMRLTGKCYTDKEMKRFAKLKLL